MKRLVVRVSLLLITFSLGVGVQTAFTSRTEVEVVPVRSEERIVKTAEIPVRMPAASPTPHLILDYDPGKFEPNGYFGIIGKKPSQFSEIGTIGVEVYEENSGPTGTMTIDTVYGPGQSYDSQQAVFGLLTSERVFFVTAPFKSGFEYRFDGVFLYKKVLTRWAGTNKVVIRGTLIKSKNGRKVAEAEVKLRLEHFGC